MNTFPDFQTRVSGLGDIRPDAIKTFQINLGKRCNQACQHCHVDASPIRTESMSRETLEQCLRVIGDLPELETVDITGGAPEMHPEFQDLVIQSKKLGKRVIDRCNLTILEEPGFEDLGEFLRDQEVEIIASLPCYTEKNTDAQRGNGVFKKSIVALQRLNSLGYGRTHSLHLVYNPGGFSLAGSQEQLERDYKKRLGEDFGILFNRLYCINNMPINRFLESLLRTGNYQEYMDKLAHAFNPETLNGLMCRNQISVGYDGGIYDCDFNQMLDMKAESVGHIRDFEVIFFQARHIRVGNHCYGCTAGAGSSCGGEIASTLAQKSSLSTPNR